MLRFSIGVLTAMMLGSLGLDFIFGFTGFTTEIASLNVPFLGKFFIIVAIIVFILTFWIPKDKK